jgi:hypothetical protein
MPRVKTVNRTVTRPLQIIKEPRNTLTTRTLINRAVTIPVVEEYIPTNILKGFTEEQVYKLPKYLFGCRNLEENGCNKQIKELNKYIEKKYAKEVQAGNNIYNDILKYVNSNRDMCINQNTNLGMNGSYLAKQIKNNQNNILVVMDETEKIPHSILTYNYDLKEQVVYIPALCVNQLEGASRGYVLINILKEACRYAGIKNILLDSVPGAIDFYRNQGFASKELSVEPYDKTLKKMTLKDGLLPYNSEEKRPYNSNPRKNERSPSPFKIKSSVTPRSVGKSISNRSNRGSLYGMSTVQLSNRRNSSQRKMDIIELQVDDIVREFESIENQSVKNIMNHFDNKNNKKTNNDKTLIDLVNDKEYILVDKHLYVNNDTQDTRFKSQNNTTRRRRRSINTVQASPISMRTRSTKRKRRL